MESPTLEEYEKAAVPKIWEWIPVLSFLYDSRMSNFIKDFMPGDPIKEEINIVFRLAFAYTLGILYLMTLITPLFSFLLNRKVIKKFKE